MISIYALINPLDENVFYVGASFNPVSRLQQHIFDSKYADTFKSTIISEILLSGNSVELLILEQCSIEDATFWEEFYISLFYSFGFHLPQIKYSGYSKTYKNKKIFNQPTNTIIIDSEIIDALKIINYYSGIRPNVFIRTAILEKMRKYINKTFPHYENLKLALFERYNIGHV